MTAAELVTELVDAGATQGHIARVLYVSPAVVSRWVAGDRTPSGWLFSELERLHRLVVTSVGVAAAGEADATPTGSADAA